MSNIKDENLVPAAVVMNAVQEALGWTLDPVLDSGNCKWSGPVRSVLPKANRSAAPTLFNVFKVFSRVALKYREVHKVIPTLIINNANKLPESLLAQFQDYAKKASDEGMATIVFVSSEGRIPRHMRGTSILSSSSVVMLTKYQREVHGQGDRGS